jgi:serpin B
MVGRWRYRIGAGVLAGILAVTCAAAAGPAPAAPPRVAAGVPRAMPGPDAPVQAVLAGLDGFGYRLSQVSTGSSGNLVCSPLSIAYAFAMARAGARGATAAQIDEVFGFPPAGTHDAFNALDRDLATGSAPAVIGIANGLFLHRGFRVEPEFLRMLATHYGAGVHTVDFGSPAAAETIDTWVRQQTAGRIKKLFDRLDPQTRLVLANAVYFKADWAVPFDADQTRPQPFTRADGSVVSAPTMSRSGSMRYAEGAGWQAVELPYRGDRMAMRIIVPTAGPASATLAPEVLAAVSAGLRPAEVSLALPKWDFTSEQDLVDTLRRLGLTEPFAAERADFTAIAPLLYIAQAVHRAAITVDEKGTEAAAVTGLGMRVTAMVTPPLVVRADHPFGYAIVDTHTGTPLFLGQVGDPTAR